MLRHAIGIVEHPITHRWQVFIITDDDDAVILASTSSHSSKSLAHLFATIILNATQNGAKINMADMIENSNENAPPDPLPQEVVNELITDIKMAYEKPSASPNFLGFW